MLMQVQLCETTGSVRFTYSTQTGGSWGHNDGCQIGVQGTPTTKWIVPSECVNTAAGNGATVNYMPPHDYSFDRYRVTFSGRALYNRYVVDQSGINSSQELNLPLAGFGVEVRTVAGATLASAVSARNVSDSWR